jgi:hypothetical protein
MGIRSYVRDRKEVKAMRAQEDGMGAKAAMGEALGFTRTANHLNAPGGATIDTYAGSNPARRGARFSAVGQGHVTQIPGGSKPRTPRNSDWDAPAGKNADGGYN